MPVLLTALPRDLDIVREIAAILVQDGGEVRCYLEDDDHELRNLGCKIAVGSLLDPANLQGALSNVHTFMPLMPDALSVDEEGLGHLRDFGLVAAEAARYSDAEQTILVLTGLGSAGSALSTVTTQILQAFEAVDPVCVLRPGIVWGSERPLKAHPSVALQDPYLEGLHVGDLAREVAAADDREGTKGSWGLVGSPAASSEHIEAGVEASTLSALKGLAPSLSKLKALAE